MGTKTTLRDVIAGFGKSAAAKLKNAAVKGAPEDQLRAPLEKLVGDLAALSGLKPGDLTLVGETSIADLRTRPDYAVTLHGALVGFIEVKAPGKGADPRRFTGHDKEQWERIQSLPNLIYTDGNAFSLWRDGELQESVIQLLGDVETSGAALDAPSSLQTLFEDFFRWQPIPPRTPLQLAQTSARLCRLLRAEVAEQIERNNDALVGLAKDWRAMLFPEASDEQFADGYAQAVTFGLLVARALNISLKDGIHAAAKQLGKQNSLIGAALTVLTQTTEDESGLRTSIRTLVRVLDAVNWGLLSKGKPDAWLYFYEDFLAVYDNDLRKQTGSYYTPPEVVRAMVRLTDEALRTRFERNHGIASKDVTVVDPAVGTGTFVLAVLNAIAETARKDLGPGAVADEVHDALKRLIAFEMQLGPFAVAQLRVFAALAELAGSVPSHAPRMYVTDTLSDPFAEETHIPQILKPIATSRKEANKVKQEERITVVIGNPPYKDKAKGLGGWIESGNANTKVVAPLARWKPPAAWEVGAHTKHLRNLYVYFWRWATWKVFDQDPAHNHGIVCFITAAGFLNGPGFQAMRAYLRETADEVWVIDCSPEGHQPEVSTRVFQGVQQPVCIVLASRSKKDPPPPPPPGDPPPVRATVRYRTLPLGKREVKFEDLATLTLDGSGWVPCPSERRAPFLPTGAASWTDHPSLESLFLYDGSGVMPGRTWIIAPDTDSLNARWRTLRDTKDIEKKRGLFHPHLRGGVPGDKHLEKGAAKGLLGHESRTSTVADDQGGCIAPTRYAFRSFDRQWIIPDARLINQPNPELWRAHSSKQLYATALMAHSPTSGPAFTFTGLIPDLHHYKGSFGGRAFPLWLDHKAEVSNVRPRLREALSWHFGREVTGEDVMAYLAAIACHPAFVARFRDDLKQPGLRIPMTANADLFGTALDLGRRVLWLHTFGERCTDPSADRPAKPPRVAQGKAPSMMKPFQSKDGEFPDTMEYNASTQCLHIGEGYVENVLPAVWDYEVSGKLVLRQWFSYRKKNRERPVIGDRRPPSPLGDIQPERWEGAYTSDLMDVLHVLTLLVQLEPAQAELLESVCSGTLLTVKDLDAVGAFDIDAVTPRFPSAILDERTGSVAGETLLLPGMAVAPSAAAKPAKKKETGKKA